MTLEMVNVETEWEDDPDFARHPLPMFVYRSIEPADEVRIKRLIDSGKPFAIRVL